MKGDKSLPNWSSRPEPAGDPKPSALAVAVGKVIEKGTEYLFGVIVFAVMTAAVSAGLMWATMIMHDHELWFPAFPFMFCWPFVWGTSGLVVWYSTLVNPDR